MKSFTYKKKIALFLVLVMLFGTVTPFGFLSPVEVEASITHRDLLQVWPGRGQLQLTGGFGTGIAPDWTDEGTSNYDQLLLSWDVVNLPGMYVLRYFTWEGHKVEVWVRRDSGSNPPSVTAEYRIFERNAAATVPNAIYTLRLPVESEQLQQLVDFHSFTCPVTESRIRYRWGRPNAPGQDNMFFFYIDGGRSINQGIVHEFTLEFYGGAGGTHAEAYRHPSNADLLLHAQETPPRPRPVIDTSRSDRVYVFRGFSATDVNIIPYAHSQNLPHTPILGWNQHAGEELRTKDDLPISPTFSSLPLDMEINPLNKPAFPPNGMDIRVRLPQFFDEASGAFEIDFVDYAEVNPTFPDINLAITMGAPSTESFAIHVPDIANFSGIPNTQFLRADTFRTLPEFNTAIHIENAEMLMTESDGRSVARFQVEGLLPSILYDYLTVAMVTHQDAHRRFFIGGSNTLDHSNVSLFTLLEHTVLPRIGGMVNVSIEPYRWHTFAVPEHEKSGTAAAVHGVYTFVLNSLTTQVGTPRYPSVNFTGGTEKINFPVFNLQQDRYYISFDPGTNRAIESQRVIFRPDARPTIGLPNNFTVENLSLRPRRMPAALWGVPPQVSYAFLSFGLSWQLGNFSDLRGLVENSEDEEITVVYKLYSGDTTEAENMKPIADIHVRVSPGDLTPLQMEYDILFVGETRPPNFRFAEPIRSTTMVTARLPRQLIDKTISHISLDQADIFRFPGVYYVMLQPFALHRNDGSPTPIQDLSDDWPTSRIASITLKDFDEVKPPPPTNLSVNTQTNPNARPALHVSFTLPTDVQWNNYLVNRYVFDPLRTFNLYISAFEGEIGILNALENEENQENDKADIEVVKIDFDDFRDNDNEINFSYGYCENCEQRYSSLTCTTSCEPVSLLHLLREGKIIQIHSIPDNLRQPAGNARESINLIITGLDENQRYYLFAEMEVAERVAVDCPVHIEFNENPGDPITDSDGYQITHISPPTALVGDVTIGTPQTPGPGEVDPSAPTGFGHNEDTLTQTEVTLHWDSIFSEDPTTIAIEYEIIRVSDTLLNIDSLFHPDGRPFTFEEIINTRPDIIGWRTNNTIEGENGRFVTETRHTPFLEVYRHLQTRTLQDLHSSFYTYNPLYRTNPLPVLVGFTDRTLRPNSLYYYYVRTVRRVLHEDPLTGEMIVLTTRSSWVEESVTTPVVQAPLNLREEDGSERFGFDPQTQVLVSWFHPAMDILTTQRAPGETLMFEYQIQEDGGPWGEIIRVPVTALTNPVNVSDGRFYLLLRGLTAGTNYQMRVRLTDIETGDISVWSNILPFTTEWNDELFQLERETQNWVEHLRRQLMELVRLPFWTATDTPDLLRVVYRPDAFRGLIDATNGTIPLYNTNARISIYYLPVSGILEAHDHRRGFSSSYDDMDIIFAPRFLSADHNRAIMDMARNVANRNVLVNDYFVRITLTRQPLFGFIHGFPPLGDGVSVQIDLVGVSTRNIRSWDTGMANHALQIIDNRAADPVVRQNMMNLVVRGEHLGERAEYVMLDYIDTVLASVRAEINNRVLRDIPPIANNVGIIAALQIPVTVLDAPLYIVSTRYEQNMSVSAFRQLRGGINPEWQALPVTGYLNGIALVTQTPGLYAFTGQTVNIPGIENISRGNAVTSLVARFGLTAVLGQGEIDLFRNATRQEVVGSIARLAGAPLSADPITWVSTHMNVTLANRNAGGLVSQQEAVALVMALYEHRTHTRVQSIIIRNHTHTANMTLDTRYAQAVRAAFELGMINSLIFQPVSPVTVGDFLDMLAALDGRVGLL
jgi:hypothetical protein